MSSVELAGVDRRWANFRSSSELDPNSVDDPEHDDKLDMACCVCLFCRTVCGMLTAVEDSGWLRFDEYCPRKSSRLRCNQRRLRDPIVSIITAIDAESRTNALIPLRMRLPCSSRTKRNDLLDDANDGAKRIISQRVSIECD